MQKTPDNIEREFAVMLPCNPKDFGKFISSLLGKPQTIEKLFKGVFCITKNEITDVYHLVDQRIHQQNDAVLTQFTVQIFYNDDSSILLNSLEDFEHYNEVRPIESVGCTLSWAYLIKFQKKDIFEKQQLDLSFRSGTSSREVIFEDGLFITRGRRWSGPGGVFLKISHTERTWGLDIESLLTGHIKNIFTKPDKTKEFVAKHSGKLGFTVAALFVIGSIVGAFWATNGFINSYAGTVAKLGKGVTSQGDLLGNKVDFLLDIITKGAWPRFILAVVGFVAVSFVVAIFFGIWVAARADKDSKSFVLLSKLAESDKKEVEQKMKRDWLIFGLSIGTSIITGIVSNILFNYYFGKL